MLGSPEQGIAKDKASENVPKFESVEVNANALQHGQKSFSTSVKKNIYNCKQLVN